MTGESGHREVAAEQIKAPALRSPQRKVEWERAAHAGLLLQKYLRGQKGDSEAQEAQQYKESLLNTVVCIKASRAYRIAYSRWECFGMHKPADRTRLMFTMTAVAPIAIGLGNASPLEVGITLHHTYGMPLIPGSALKGLCRRGALLLMREDKLSKEKFEFLFGTGGDKNPAAGAIVFYDAWYDPSSPEEGEGKPFHRDVITVHHPKYYRERGKTPPTDFDDPNTVPFLVIKPGVRFLFVLDAVSRDCADYAKRLLQWCLSNLGVGAKTNAGYGYLK